VPPVAKSKVGLCACIHTALFLVLQKMFLFNAPLRLTPATRVTTYYFVHSMSVGVINAFVGIWFAYKGITPEQIGFITSAPLVVLLFVGVAVGRLADQASDWRPVIVVGAVISGIVPLSLFFAEGYVGILIVWTVCVVSQMAILPVVDAASIRLGRRVGFEFSHLYAWKTIGYMLTIFVAGFVIAEIGITAFVPIFVGLSLLRAATAFGLPQFRETSKTLKASLHTDKLRDVLRPWFLFPLIGWALVHSTHFVLNGFLGLLWHEQGIAESTIGLLIVVGSVAELGMFVGFKRFAGRVTPRALILASCLVAVVRWTAFAFSPSVPILFGLQILQALTYALGFLACTHFIADVTDESIAAQAQSFFGILQSAVAILALVSFGWLAAMFGAYAFLASASLAALGALLVVISMILKK
jgi:MFS transporter, PPP family, 3-phenylpropionic acid transporter